MMPTKFCITKQLFSVTITSWQTILVLTAAALTHLARHNFIALAEWQVYTFSDLAQHFVEVLGCKKISSEAAKSTQGPISPMGKKKLCSTMMTAHLKLQLRLFNRSNMLCGDIIYHITQPTKCALSVIKMNMKNSIQTANLLCLSGSTSAIATTAIRNDNKFDHDNFAFQIE